MDFRHEVLNLINNFIKKNYDHPNELWLGELQEYQMNCYINLNLYLRVSGKDCAVSPRYKQKTEFLGLKVRFIDAPNYFKVEYNQYYD